MSSPVETGDFSGNDPLVVSACRPHPGRENTFEDVPRGVLVSMQGEPTVRTVVPTNRQFLRDVGTTPATLLARTSRVTCRNLTTSTWSLVREDDSEIAPCNIGNRTGQSMVPEHPTDVQAFYRNEPIRPDESQSGFVMEVVPHVAYTSVQNLDTADCFVSISAVPFLSGDSTLQASEAWKLPLEKPRVFDTFSVRSSKERFDPDVDAYSGFAVWRDLYVEQFTRKYHKPLSCFIYKAGGSNGTLDRSVNAHFDVTDMLNTQSVTTESDTVSVDVVFDTTKAVTRLTTGIAGFFAVSTTAEEGSKCFVQTTQSCLCRRGVQFLIPDVGSFFGSEPYCLGSETNRLLSLRPRKFPLFETGVVEASMCLQHDAKFPLLVGVRVETELVSTPHLCEDTTDGRDRQGGGKHAVRVW